MQMIRFILGTQAEMLDGGHAELPSSSAGRRGLLSQALQAEPTAQPAEDAEQAGDEAQTQDTGPQGNTVVSSPAMILAVRSAAKNIANHPHKADMLLHNTIKKGCSLTRFDNLPEGRGCMQARLVRHWQHHPITLPSVTKLRLDRSTSSAEPASSSGEGSGRYVTPVVLSKVQHYLDTSAPAPPAGSISGFNVPAAAAAGMSSTTVQSLHGRPLKLAYSLIFIAPDEAGLPVRFQAILFESQDAKHASMLSTGDNPVQQIAPHAMPAAHSPGAAIAVSVAVASESSIRRHNGLGKPCGVRGDRSMGGASCWSTVTQVGLRGTGADLSMLCWCSTAGVCRSAIIKDHLDGSRVGS